MTDMISSISLPAAAAAFRSSDGGRLNRGTKCDHYAEFAAATHGVGAHWIVDFEDRYAASGAEFRNQRRRQRGAGHHHEFSLISLHRNVEHLLNALAGMRVASCDDSIRSRPSSSWFVISRSGADSP